MSHIHTSVMIKLEMKYKNYRYVMFRGSLFLLRQHILMYFFNYHNKFCFKKEDQIIYIYTGSQNYYKDYSWLNRHEHKS